MLQSARVGQPSVLGRVSERWITPVLAGRPNLMASTGVLLIFVGVQINLRHLLVCYNCGNGAPFPEG
jgi:hypothetical protein